MNVAGVSTEFHPQIKKYMTEEQKDNKHHIDPRHACKNVQKKTVLMYTYYKSENGHSSPDYK